MPTIAQTVRDLVFDNPMLHLGLHHRLLNLSQVARFLQPIVAANAKKEVTASAILMSLSRLQRELAETSPPEAEAFYVDRINVHTGLCSITFAKTPEAHQELTRLVREIQTEQGYLTLTEGIREVTLLIEERNVARARAVLSLPPRKVHRHLAGLGVQFNEAYVEKPGLLYHLLQQLALQHINVVEVASTSTEFNIYLQADDLMPAFDAIYHRFKRG